ncbi:hypothetical protein HK414_08135 [Ramlibacter terrae]|uniref:CHAT domain-containing protein n=1 Tax=Ramlibacter terrae TaxID=2732511 RepID=A0ABX6P482_9BURK|nr:hypothetical protein HK414_08135 [Ramlibacter terrae]
MLLDLPDDDEVEGFLSSECEIVKAILASRGLGGRIKHFRFTSLQSLERPASYEYDPKFVHISGHGGNHSISLLGGEVTRNDLAEDFLAPRLKVLEGEETRILFVSTCFSEHGVDRILDQIPDRFTGAYYFSEDEVPFADALTAAAMFYRRKELNRPHQKILANINSYFGKKKRLFYRSAP